VVELTSDARRQAEVIRGEADAERNAIYAEAFGRDPEFFAFTRSLTSYERAMKGTNSSIVMQPDSVFFEYLRGYGVPGSGIDTGEAAGGLPGVTSVAPAPEPEASVAPEATGIATPDVAATD
jgi:membrane protease subunit HflC